MSDLLELNAELLAILELPEDLQHRLISAIQVATFSAQLEELELEPLPTMAPPAMEQPDLSTPRPLAKQTSIQLQRQPLPELVLDDADTISQTIQLHKQASAGLTEEIHEIERKLSRVSSRNLLRQASMGRLSASVPSSSAASRAIEQAAAQGAQHPAALSRAGSRKGSSKLAAAAAPPSAGAAAIVGASTEPAASAAQRAPAQSIGGGVSDRIAALRQREAAIAKAATEAVKASSSRPRKPAASEEALEAAKQLVRRISAQLAEATDQDTPSSMAFPTRGGVQQAREAFSAREAAAAAQGLGSAEATGPRQPATDGAPSQRELQALRAMFGGALQDATAVRSTAPAAPAPSGRVKNAALIARFEAKRAELAAANRVLGKAAGEPASGARFERRPSARAPPGEKPPVAQSSKAAFFEEMAKRSQADQPPGPTMASQREQAMKAIFGGGQKDAAKMAPPVTQNAKAKFFEEMAKQADQSAPSVPTQREQAMKAMFGGVPKGAAKTGPHATQSTKAMFEEKAKQAQRPSMPTQREQAMRAFGATFGR